MFKVIKIISDKRIVINAGKNEVQTGDILRVIEKNSEEIVDPDTNEVLGTLDYIKATITVEYVYEHMSICKNYETKTVNALDPFETLRQREVTSPLNVNLSQITGGYNIDNKLIEIYYNIIIITKVANTNISAFNKYLFCKYLQ